MNDDMDFDITYSVTYQNAERPGTWFVFTNTKHWEHGQRNTHATFSLDEAMTSAQELLDGKQFTDSRPKYQRKITATQVVQHIYGGGAILTYGTPAEA